MRRRCAHRNRLRRLLGTSQRWCLLWMRIWRVRSDEMVRNMPILLMTETVCVICLFHTYAAVNARRQPRCTRSLRQSSRACRQWLCLLIQHRWIDKSCCLLWLYCPRHMAIAVHERGERARRGTATTTSTRHVVQLPAVYLFCLRGKHLLLEIVEKGMARGLSVKEEGGAVSTTWC